MIHGAVDLVDRRLHTDKDGVKVKGTREKENGAADKRRRWPGIRTEGRL